MMNWKKGIWTMRAFRTVIIVCMALALLLAGCGVKPSNQTGSAESAPSAQSESNSKETIPSDLAENNSNETIPSASGERISIETVTTDDFSMNYFKFGRGDKTFVLLPGLSAQGVMGSADQIALAYQMMTEDFTIYVFDPRNDLPDVYTVSDMAEDIAKVFQKLGLDHVYVMGASMGGMMSLELAVHHPELIEKMVLASSALQMKEQQYVTLDNWLHLAQEGDTEALYLAFGEAIYPEEIFEQSREALVEASRTVTEEDLKRFIILCESMRDFDITNDLAKIDCPILAINDKEDHVLGEEAIETMKQYMNQSPDWEFYLYDGYGHAVYDTAPDFKERMLNFFQAE